MARRDEPEEQSEEGRGVAIVTAHVALGSNLGDREAHLACAVRALDATPGIEVERASSLYETQPVGDVPQGAYLNAVVALRTTLEPRVLLARLLEIEARAGRTRGPAEVRWGPRTLDLDLLLYADLCLDAPGLTLPHPRLHERAFVLEPLCELVPELLHPRLGERLGHYRELERDPDGVRRWPRPLAFVIDSAHDGRAPS